MIPGGEEQTERLELNLRLIPVHQGLSHGLVWLPIFVLFTRGRFDLDGALLLASLYYLFVVVLEVPSGWLSDRVGRVFTLRIAAVSWVIAHACFIVGADYFWLVVLGQFFMASGFASLSGTDVTFHYDTLESLGRAADYTDRQARVSSIGYAITALSALVGGGLGLINVRYAFVAALVVALAQLVVTTQLNEPPSTGRAESFGRQLVTCGGYLRPRFLRWIFLYGVILVTLEHVAATLMQPWLTELLGRTATDLGSTPLVAGAVFCAVALVGSAAARASAPLSRRFGVVATLLGFAVLSALIVTAMAASFHWVVLAAIVFRSAQTAAAPVLISAAVSEQTERHHRATLLSINSLAGRLGYGLLLALVATDAGDDVAAVLVTLGAVAWSLVVVLVVTAMRLTRGERLSQAA